MGELPGWVEGDRIELRHRVNEDVLVILEGEVEGVSEEDGALAIRVEGVDGNNLLAYEMRLICVEDRPYWIDLADTICAVVDE